MLQCWQQEPNDRPTFSTLKNKITNMMQNNNVSSSNDLNISKSQVIRTTFSPCSTNRAVLFPCKWKNVVARIIKSMHNKFPLAQTPLLTLICVINFEPSLTSLKRKAENRGDGRIITEKRV